MVNQQEALERLTGLNLGYILELYEVYRRDATAVTPEWRAFFEQWGPHLEQLAAPSPAAAIAGPAFDFTKVAAVVQLAQRIRHRGHRAARLDPLGSPPPGDPALDPAYHGLTSQDLEHLPATLVGGPAAQGARNAAEAIGRLREIYCGTIGYDYGHLQDRTEREWLEEAIESERYRVRLSPTEKRALLERLTAVEVFERFLHRTFVGQKRFSIEGTDTLVPILDEILRQVAETGIPKVAMGMAHRGRLNVLAHVLGKPYEQILAEFMGLDHREPVALTEGGTLGYTGDVKYHMGGIRAAGQLQVILAHNPSHLEFVDPVVEGMARALQERRDRPGAPEQDVDACLPILIHGDAAFPGEGIVAETLNMSGIPGYATGGTLHIIVNNQLGYTTEPQEGRSTFYASDPARGFEIPVIHVNADDPEACLTAARLAFAYRQRFHKDVLIDLIGYRRWGHNEGDEPTFTQPVMYRRIAEHPTVRELWAQRLVAEGIVTRDEAAALEQELFGKLQHLRQEVLTRAQRADQVNGSIGSGAPTLPTIATAVPLETLKELNRQAHTLPAGFNLNPKLRRQLQRRLEIVEREEVIDWAHAELLAFASLLAEGIPIRLTGQDTIRGTFSQRHVAFYDFETGERVIPLQQMPAARASFAVYNSPLSEAGPLGFEYGYSVQAPDALVLWEAQFGDFANVAQVIIDQFIVSGWAKWRQRSALVLLLPHGYEGQGPEHSSARLERFLQLAAEDNVRIANCTTAAQYFHLLRRQAILRTVDPRPLIVMTPKSLLRHPRAMSPMRELAEGRFQPVLDDPTARQRPDDVTRLILCSGKVYVDLVTSQFAATASHVAIVRVEELYPFPGDELAAILRQYPNARDVVWLQEEPKNMGAWTYMQPRLQPLLNGRTLRYIGRPERASPAEGFAEMHEQEQARIIGEAFAGVPEPAVPT
ncbi:MAG: 2-oxoglutarate dehydrogenase E1 component [Thermomicrobium sp.]|uniref:2-oxoglutarate dehydrogenase E1 component n=1 Tax=Thermomicrobium sp. TaxID=1969469 RepID=UPI001B1D6C6F|nr:2-oxoglutarate dehydrogenase E1 component [Thermomicrobium sp.]MBO9359530.1 2-oxoglutarate dehydrogenase E1 component [Thermomicrobium sp.]